MFYENAFPVLEWDDSPTAKLNPANFMDGKFDADKLVITFFPDVVNRLIASGQITEARRIPGENPFPVYRFTALPNSPTCCWCWGSAAAPPVREISMGSMQWALKR